MRSKIYKEKDGPSDGDFAMLEARVKALEASLVKRKPRTGSYSVDQLTLELETTEGARAETPVFCCDETGTMYYISTPPRYSEEYRAVVIDVFPLEDA